MAHPTDLPSSKLAAHVVSSEFTCPDPKNLAIVKKVLTPKCGNFDVTDVNNGLISFQVKGSFCLHRQRVLFDASGFPIITLSKKLLSAHKTWKVFKGKSTDAKDLLFTVKKSSIFQLKKNLDIFLANNTSEHMCDFKVKSNCFEKSCIVYVGEDDSTIIAKMNKKHSLQSIFLGKVKFEVTVFPNVDYAFIIALTVIMDEMRK